MACLVSLFVWPVGVRHAAVVHPLLVDFSLGDQADFDTAGDSERRQSVVSVFPDCNQILVFVFFLPSDLLHGRSLRIV